MPLNNNLPCRAENDQILVLIRHCQHCKYIGNIKNYTALLYWMCIPMNNWISTIQCIFETALYTATVRIIINLYTNNGASSETHTNRIRVQKFSFPHEFSHDLKKTVFWKLSVYIIISCERYSLDYFGWVSVWENMFPRTEIKFAIAKWCLNATLGSVRKKMYTA